MIRRDSTFNKVFGKKFEKWIITCFDHLSNNDQIINAVRINDINLLTNILKDFPSIVLSEIRDEDGEDLLKIAVSSGHLNIVKFLLKDHSEEFKNIKYSENGDTLLHFAFKNKHDDIVNFLIQSGFNEKVVNHKGKLVWEM